MLNNIKSWAFALFLMAFVSSPNTPVSALKNAAVARARSLQETVAPLLSPWDCELGEFYSLSDDTCKQCDGSCPLCFGITSEDCFICPNG